MNPPLAQQGAALVGLELPWASSSPAENTSDEEKLAPFLAQYPFPDHQNNTAVPTATVAPSFFSDPVPAVTLPAYTAPIAPFPMPAVEAVAPEYTAPVVVAPVAPASVYSESVQSPTDWDSAVTMPISPPSVIENFLPLTPAQEPAPAPQQSIYVATSITQPFQDVPFVSAPPQEVFPIVVENDASGFAKTRGSVQQQQPILTAMAPPTYSSVPQVLPPPAPPTYPTQFSPPPATATIQTPAVLIEEVPVHGTETVARVGTQHILMGDILPKLRRAALEIVAMEFEKMPEETRAKVSQQEIEQVTNAIATQHYPEMLQEQILFALVYSDYLSQQGSEQRNFFNEKLGEEFDRKEVPTMLKEFNVENVAALKQYLAQQLGSSLDKEKRQWIREQIVRQWISMSIDKAAPAATQDEMLDFYEKNQAMFTSTARARWQEMVVLFSRHSTEKEAWDKIKWMGNQVANGASSFEVMAKTQSDGFTAPENGVWDWTTKGSLASAELEQAIFSQPRGQLSPAIIRSERGLHIIRVLERQESTVTPFIEAQVTIRERIKNLRIQRNQDEYLSELRRRFPVVVVKDRIDFDINNTRTASSVR